MPWRTFKRDDKLTYTHPHPNLSQVIIHQTPESSNTQEKHGILIPPPPKAPGVQPGKHQRSGPRRARRRGPRGHPRARRRDAPVQQGAGRDSRGHPYLERGSVGFTRSAHKLKPCRTGTLTYLIFRSGRPQLDTVPGSGIVLPRRCEHLLPGPCAAL